MNPQGLWQQSRKEVHTHLRIRTTARARENRNRNVFNVRKSGKTTDITAFVVGHTGEAEVLFICLNLPWLTQIPVS